MAAATYFACQKKQATDGQCRRTKITPALECKDGSHETATGPRGSELGGDDGTQWVIAANTHTHYEPPADEGTDDTDCGTLATDRLTKGGNNDNHKLDTI